MKIILIALMTLSLGVFANSSTEFIANTKTSFRSHVDSFVRINKNDNLYVLVAKKTERRGLNGCRMHRGTISTRKCRVSTTRVTIPNLSLEGSDIVYDNGAMTVNCGYVKDTWLGQKVKMSKNCKLENLKNSGYTTTQFVVSE